MPKQIVFALVTFVHNLCTAIWIGGLLTLGLSVLPAARSVLGMGPQTKKLMHAIQERLSRLVYASIVGLIATGMLLSRRNLAFTGLFSFANPYSTVLSLKHILVIGMVALALLRSLWFSRDGKPSNPTREKQSVAILLLNMVLGVGVLLLSGLGAALSSGPPA